MRQYRAWHKAEKVMCEVSLINFELGAFLIGVKPGKGEICGDQIVIAPDNGRFCYWDEIEMLESTGLKDKDGVNIFEGDILQITDPNWDVNKDENHIVKWDDEASCYPIYVSIGDYDVTSLGWANQMDYGFEVIGNIHENPDLV